MKAIVQLEDGSRYRHGIDVQKVGDSMLRVGKRLFKTTGGAWFEIEWNPRTQRWRRGGRAKVIEIKNV